MPSSVPTIIPNANPDKLATWFSELNKYSMPTVSSNQLGNIRDQSLAPILSGIREKALQSGDWGDWNSALAIATSLVGMRGNNGTPVLINADRNPGETAAQAFDRNFQQWNAAAPERASAAAARQAEAASYPDRGVSQLNPPGLAGGSGPVNPPGSFGGPGTEIGTGVNMPTFNSQAGVPSNLAQITNLINSLNQTAQQSANAARIPNAAGLEGISSTNIQNELRGIIPDDVLRLLQQQAAERGAARGIAGSPNESAAYLRALGLTSLDLTDRGQKNLAMALGRNPAAPIFDPTGLIMTPFQSGQLATDAYRLALQQQEIASQNALRQAQIGQTVAETGQVGKSPTPWWVTENDTSGNWWNGGTGILDSQPWRYYGGA